MFDSAVRFALIIIAAGLICFMTAELALALIRLDWRDNSNNEDGFTLERRLGTSGSYTALANVSANIVTYTDTATSSGKTYCYRIYAFNKVGKSGYSNAHCATAKSSATTLSLAAGNESSQTANAALVNPASSGDKARTGGAMDPITARYDKIGIYRPSTGEWLLDRSGNRTWDGCSIDACPELLRLAGAVPIAGDWGRSGVSKIGVFVAATDEMYLDKNGNGEWDGCKVDSCSAGVGGGKNFVVVGNWTGAKDQVGFFSADNRRWNLEGAAACGTALFRMEYLQDW